MPTYLCHGFRWHRRNIRIFVILQDLEDAAPDWIVGRTTSSEILSQFHAMFDFIPEPATAVETTPGPRERPEHEDDDFALPPARVADADDDVLMHGGWSSVKLLEEYDPEDVRSHARPYAYVADCVVRVDLSVDLGEEMRRYEEMMKRRGGVWFERLRDQVQAGEEIKWYVVVCGDTAREVPGEVNDDEEEEDKEGASVRRLQGPERGVGRLRVSTARGGNEARRSGQGMHDGGLMPGASTPGGDAWGSGTRMLYGNEYTTASQGTASDTQGARPALKSKSSVAAGLRKLFKRKDEFKGK